MTIKERHIADGIYVYDNALSDDLCDGIWDFYYEHFDLTSAGKTVGGNQPDIKKTRDFYDTNSLFTDEETLKIYKEYDNEIYKGIRASTKMYIDRYNWLQRCPNLIDTGYLWQGYKKGEGFYNEHIDGENWTAVSRDRVLAIVAYINTVEEGGQTYFRHQEVSVKPLKDLYAFFQHTGLILIKQWFRYLKIS